MGGLHYDPLLARRLNPNIAPDKATLSGRRPPAGKVWFGAFLPVMPPDPATLEGPHPIAPTVVDLAQPPEQLAPASPPAADWDRVLSSSQPTRRDAVLGTPVKALEWTLPGDGRAASRLIGLRARQARSGTKRRRRRPVALDDAPLPAAARHRWPVMT